MRVAFINHNGAQLGGAEATLLTYLKRLPEDIEPYFITFSDGPFANAVRALNIPVEVFPVPASVTGSTRERPLFQAMWALPSLAYSLAGRLRQLSVDLVFTNTMKAHVLGLVAAKLAGRPSVLYLHDILTGRARAIIRTVGAMCSTERLVCAPIVARYLDLPATTVLYGAPIDYDDFTVTWDQRSARTALGIPDDGPLFAIVGRINRWKGHDRFVQAAARVLSIAPARFAIVGDALFRDEDFPTELHRLVSDLGLSDRITFHPWQSDPRVIYAAADVNVNCSEREPFARTTVEAAAYMRPTICFDDGGTCEAVENSVSGFVVPAQDVNAMAAAMLQYITRPDLLQSAKEAAGRRARAYDAAVLATTFIDTLHRVSGIKSNTKQAA